MTNGFLTACFPPLPVADKLWETASSFEICALQFFYATIIHWQTQGEKERITAAFQMLLGPAAQVFWIAAHPPFPNLSICVMPTFVVVVSDGTPNFQALAMQAFSLIIPPQDQGIFSSYVLWYNVSVYIHAVLQAIGIDKNKKVMLAGHSMGAAAVDNLAARYKAGAADRVIRMITFGAPRVGDSRLNDWLRKCPNISICNEDDIVCSVPPDQLTINPVALALGMPNLFVWDEWIREPNRARMDVNGQLTRNENPIIDTPLLTHLVTQILAGQPFDIVAPHFIEEYRRRIDVRCPDEQWPISEELWAYLHEDDLRDKVALKIGAAVIEEFESMCGCCPGHPSPDEFGIYLTSTDYPLLDGLEINMAIVDPPPDCLWIDTSSPFEGAMVVQLEDWVPSSGLPLLLVIDWIGSPYGDLSLVHAITNVEFSCTPWQFAFTATTSINGTPTSSTITVRSGPAIERTFAGVQIGAEVVDEEPTEEIAAAFLFGAQIGEEPIDAAVQLGGEVVDATAPVESFDAAFLIGAECTD